MRSNRGVFSALGVMNWIIRVILLDELLSRCHNFMFLVAYVRGLKEKQSPYSNYLDLISVYGGGGSSGIPVDVPCVLGVCVT